MDDKNTGLSNSVAQIVKRIFTDSAFKEDALEHPDLAFEGYDLDEEERGALKSLLGRPSLFSTQVGPETENFWWH